MFAMGGDLVAVRDGYVCRERLVCDVKSGYVP